MGSKKKKTEKQKDFAKQKLRVGKTAAKPSNHTDTSFVAKRISMPNQSINRKTPANSKGSNTFNAVEEADILHHLSLTKHHSSTTRKEVLIYIQQHLPSNPSLYKQILNSITPLIVDQSSQVRNTLVDLLNAAAEQQPGLLDLHCRSVTLFINSAMSHIVPEIRNDSTKFLDVLIKHAGGSLIKSSFIKTLKAFFQILSWTLRDDKKSVSVAITMSTGANSKKARINHLKTLRKFIKIGILPPDVQEKEESVLTLHPMGGQYLLPTTPQPFSALKLFTKELPSNIDSTSNGSGSRNTAGEDTFSLNDLNTLSTEDIDTRRKLMKDVFIKQMRKGLASLIKEGGEVGREANSISDLLEVLDDVKKSEGLVNEEE